MSTTPPPSSASSAPPPGWMPDPSGMPGVQRWWDGSAWTEHTQTTQAASGGGGGAGRRGCLLGCGGLLALLLVVGVLSAAFDSGSGTDGGSGDDRAQSGGSGSGGGEDEERTVSLRRPLELEGTRYSVTSARTATELGDSEFDRVEPDGVFVVVEVELTNLKNDTRTIAGDALKLVSRDGREYDTSDDALLATDDQIVFEDIQPNLTKTGTLVFDVPEAATRGARLRVEDLFSDERGFVRLGLG